MSKFKYPKKTPITYNRPVVLDVSTLRKFPTKRSIVAATLPFRPDASYPRHVSNVIKETKRKWAWFSAARARDDKLGTRLGTLNYLPLEIRQQIYEYIVQAYHIHLHHSQNRKIWRYAGRDRWIENAFRFNLPTSPQDRLSTPGNPDVWAYDSYWLFYPIGNLAIFRLTSPTIKVEYEHWFLRSHEFAFECPAAYHEFMAQLTAEQRGWIRRLRIEAFSWETNDWRSGISDEEADAGWVTICNELPLTVEMVTLHLDRHCRLKLPATYSVLAGWRRTFKEIREVRRAAETICTLRRRILRRIPHVQTEFGGWEYDRMIPEDKETIRRAWEEDVESGDPVRARAIWKEPW